MSVEAIEIYRARTLPEAHALRNALEGEGIWAGVDNEALQDAVGGLVPGWTTAPRVLVRPGDEAAARAVVEQFLKQVASPSEGEELRCLACGAAMGQTYVCPACGWSYAQDSDAAIASVPLPPGPVAVEAQSPAAGSERPEAATPGGESAAAPPALASRALWGEVIAVLAVGIMPDLISALSLLVNPLPPPPYWLEALQRTVLSGCTVYVTLYLIRRSGEPLARFGLVRPRLHDVPLGIGLFLLAEALWLFCCAQIRWDVWPPVGNGFPRPRLPEDYALMVLQFGASGFAEELVNRAYLITRLEQLLRSRAAAVLLSAALFASYHCYQGSAGLASQMAFGVAYGIAFLGSRRVWPLAIGHALCNIWLDLAA